jgi:hypothetical protein
VTCYLYLKVAFTNPGYLDPSQAFSTTDAFDIDEDIEQMKKYQDKSKQLKQQKRQNKLKKKQSVLSKGSTQMLTR